jgi:hypothetical protein
MRHLVYLASMLALAAFLTTSSVAAPTTTASQLTTRFKAATGEKLVVNKQYSSAGHYKAYDLGIPNAFKKAKWGTFTVYLVTGADVETEIADLLKNTRTGLPDPKSAGGIYWESGTSIYGAAYWQAKRRYGQNVVVKWIGSSGVKKTDATWKRLHTALTKATK